MSNVKERIFGAVTIMSEEDAVKVWNLIQGAVALSNAEEVAPYPDELAAIAAYKAGDQLSAFHFPGRSDERT